MSPNLVSIPLVGLSTKDKDGFLANIAERMEYLISLPLSFTSFLLDGSIKSYIASVSSSPWVSVSVSDSTESSPVILSRNCPSLP